MTVHIDGLEPNKTPPYWHRDYGFEQYRRSGEFDPDVFPLVNPRGIGTYDPLERFNPLVHVSRFTDWRRAEREYARAYRVYRRKLDAYWNLYAEINDTLFDGKAENLILVDPNDKTRGTRYETRGAYGSACTTTINMTEFVNELVDRGTKEKFDDKLGMVPREWCLESYRRRMISDQARYRLEIIREFFRQCIDCRLESFINTSREKRERYIEFENEGRRYLLKVDRSIEWVCMRPDEIIVV